MKRARDDDRHQARNRLKRIRKEEASIVRMDNLIQSMEPRLSQLIKDKDSRNLVKLVTELASANEASNASRFYLFNYLHDKAKVHAGTRSKLSPHIPIEDLANYLVSQDVRLDHRDITNWGAKNIRKETLNPAISIEAVVKFAGLIAKPRRPRSVGISIDTVSIF